MATQTRENLISVDEARNIILDHVNLLDVEIAGVINALGKTVAEDICSAGDVAIPKGALIGPAQMGTLAALGKPGVAVTRKPKVSIITMGSELVDIMDDIKDGQTRNSNRYSLAGMVLAAGCEIGPLLHIREGKDSMIAALTKALKADVVITLGGTSSGEHDLIREAIERLGTLHISKVAAKPGRPVYFATIEDKPVFALPGNPHAATIAFEVFVRPALLKMLSRKAIDRPIVTASILNSVQPVSCHRQFYRAHTVWQAGGYVTELINDCDNSLPKTIMQTDSIVIIREDREEIRQGDKVEVMLLDSYFQM